jgi:hypothetical protein
VITIELEPGACRICHDEGLWISIPIDKIFSPLPLHELRKYQHAEICTCFAGDAIRMRFNLGAGVVT